MLPLSCALFFHRCFYFILTISEENIILHALDVTQVVDVCFDTIFVDATYLLSDL